MRVDIDTSILRGELRKQEPMFRHTSWKTGGDADYYYRAADSDDLSVFISGLPRDMPVTWIGFGSNLLVRDGGIPGAVISVVGVLDDLEITNETEITVGAGIPCAKAARFAARAGLGGVEFLAGIPGSMGGALAMNAGAYGGEIWRYVKQAETINRNGERKIYTKDQLDIAYRSVSLPENEWFIACHFELEISDRDTVERRISTMLSERAEAQPLGQHSCGSVFRNPADDHAARLIDSCGLKGTGVGGATVSEKHANFIINSGNATSLDIEQLIELIQATVYEKYAVKLIPEVRIIGEMGNEH
ncbi:MAG: UDP-N-acetylmuramate dehydrogenase [Proteobacteria bacterium]|nr:UDP-N-acetylmuramate dehydrogenase [Pseudomonadota bacterium]